MPAMNDDGSKVQRRDVFQRRFVPVKWIPVILGCAAFCSARAAEALTINEAQSRVEIVVAVTGDSFTGRLARYQSDVGIEDGRVVSAVVRFRVGDVHTGREGRDDDLHAWQQTRRHPDGMFTLVELKPDGTRFKAHGTLVLHGVSREVDFPVSVVTDGTLYAIDGVARLDTREFGLPVLRKFWLLKVDPRVKVSFHLQGTVESLDSARERGASLQAGSKAP
jgi:polyisoprenoid-binding protein YceI